MEDFREPDGVILPVWARRALLSASAMRRYLFIQQFSEEDCGAGSVLMVARHYGKKVPRQS